MDIQGMADEVPVGDGGLKAVEPNPLVNAQAVNVDWDSVRRSLSSMFNMHNVDSALQMHDDILAEMVVQNLESLREAKDNVEWRKTH